MLGNSFIRTYRVPARIDWLSQQSEIVVRRATKSDRDRDSLIHLQPRVILVILLESYLFVVKHRYAVEDFRRKKIAFWSMHGA